VRFLGVGGVAGEIPHARQIKRGLHVILPWPEVDVRGAADLCERALHGVGELGFAVAREHGVAVLPRLLIEIGLKEGQIIAAEWDAGMGIGPGGNSRRAEKRDGCEYNEFFHVLGGKSEDKSSGRGG